MVTPNKKDAAIKIFGKSPFSLVRNKQRVLFVCLIGSIFRTIFTYSMEENDALLNGWCLIRNHYAHVIPECSAPREHETDLLKTNNAEDWLVCIAHRTLHNKALKHVVQQTGMRTADCTVLLSTEHAIRENSAFCLQTRSR